MLKTPRHRSSVRTLERLANGPILYEIPGTETGQWDDFRIRSLAQTMAGSPAGKRVAAEIAKVKRHGSDAEYLRWMQTRPRLREQCLRWGTTQAE